jgi:superfamily II DNA or RNA helicase
MSTPYHAKYFAYELTRTGGEGVERLGRSLFDAAVDLNPHQIDAALFAMRSPLSKGVLLADEVGLGKTIEAGLVICQHWAERRRKILVVAPATLRKQWEQELAEKFHLPAYVIDAKTYRTLAAEGHPNPFTAGSIAICSLHFAAAHAAELRSVAWDLVVIDEAHKLRNAYRQSNRIGQSLRWALEDRRKLLLTATPLQNSLLELYGLATLIDERLFGDLPSFRTQYMNASGNLGDLRRRLEPFCMRTLRRQVLEYVRYTERRLITRPFQPTQQEQDLYEAISAYLQRPQSYALPSQQRHLITMLVRKVLASSPLAVAGTLSIMRDRLVRLREQVSKQMDRGYQQNPVSTVVQRALQDEMLDPELDAEILDALLEDQEDLVVDEGDEGSGSATPLLEYPGSESPGTAVDLRRLDVEIEDLNRYIAWARSIGIDTKTRALRIALDVGFSEMAKMGAAQKAVIFTESRRSQQFLKDFLEANGYAGRVLLFNGVNNDPESTVIYQGWLERVRPEGRSSGSRAVDVRTAIVEEFRDAAPILIATEAAAEGINLQFCSLVINYDLPWNPQRIEQRIGRCHRYGQKYDVVVINFLNEHNEADRRVYELLEEKFNLFNGVFGASDDVLGTVESGIDFERRILDIYQQCRTPSEIQTAFARLQEELDAKIRARMQDTRRILLEHFDEDVHTRLKLDLLGAQQRLDTISRMFWSLTRTILAGAAHFDDVALAFDLHHPPQPGILPRHYRLIAKSQERQDGAGSEIHPGAIDSGEFLYRLGHPLGEHVLAQGKACATPMASVTFDITHHPTRISVVEQRRGQSGYLVLHHLRIDTYESEDHLLFSAMTDSGEVLDPETCAKLFYCNARVASTNSSLVTPSALAANAERYVAATISQALERSNRHFQEAREQLEQWAEDMELAANKELDDVKQQLKILNRQARQAITLQEQHALQEQIRKLEDKKRRHRQRIFAVEDEIVAKRDALIDALEKRMQQKTSSTLLFAIRWQIV